MNLMRKIFTSESVSEGHPDKLCDQISDAILDECLKQDPESLVACETFITDNLVVIGGEISSKAKVDYEKIARWLLKKVGYSDAETGIDPDNCEVIVRIHEQSPDIAKAVHQEELKAGDQGLMFGYANNETPNLTPFSIQVAHDLVHLASALRKAGVFKWAKPDMKSQVTMDFTNENNPRIDTILMSIQHDKDYNEDEFKRFIKNSIMDVIAKRYNLNTDFNVIINPAGRFVIGGPKSDTGLTGRKIIADTYGGCSRHGGGAFSGKDGTKVDRSAAYMCRYAAKNMVAAGLADKVEVQVSYAIGQSEPMSVLIETFGTNKIPMEKIYKIFEEHFDFNVNSIIEKLELKKPVYFRTSKYGHFGKKEFTWEKTDKVRELEVYQ